MLQFNTGRPNEPAHLVASGSTTDIVTDIGMLIIGVHTQLRKSDPASAALFQDIAVKKMVNDPEIHLWDMEARAAFGLAVRVPEKKDGDENV